MAVDKPEKPDIIQATIKHLIKSGGGNGPVKPGNLRDRKVPNPAVRRKMRLMKRLIAPRRRAGRIPFAMYKEDKI